MAYRSFPSIKKAKNTDIFSPSFQPYIIKTKGFYTYENGVKKVHIPNHYTLIEKYRVSPVDFRNSSHVKTFKIMERNKRIYVD